MILAVAIAVIILCIVAIYFSLRVLADSRRMKKKMEEENRGNDSG